MDYRFSLLSPSSTLWADIEASPDASCFFTAAWADYQQRKGRRTLIVAIEAEGTTIGWFVGHRKWLGIWVISSPAMGTGTYSQGICMRQSTPTAERVAIYQALAQWLYRERLASYIQVCDDWINDWHSPELDAAGIHYSPRHTYRLDLTPTEEELWAALHYKSCKYSINKARREGLTVRAIEREEDIDPFLDRHTAHLHDVLSRHHSRGLPCQRRNYLQALCHALFPNHILMLEVVDSMGRSIASGIFVHAPGGAQAFTLASLTDSLRLCPNELLVWEGIRRLNALGVRDLNFGGIAHYKSKYGSRFAFVPVMIFSRHTRLLNLRRLLKQKYQDLISHHRK